MELLGKMYYTMCFIIHMTNYISIYLTWKYGWPKQDLAHTEVGLRLGICIRVKPLLF